MANDVNPYEFLWIVKESSYGTAMSVPTAGTDSIYIRLTGGNAFTPREKTITKKFDFGGGWAGRGYTQAKQYSVEGDLSLDLCYSQAQLLLDWAITRLNSGQTTPWVTTEPPGDLASCSVYHGVMRLDGTIRRRLYQGMKVKGWSLPCSAETGSARLKLSLRGQRVAASDPSSVVFPVPADTAFPIDPVMFQHLTGPGSVSLASVSQTFIEGINFDVTNAIDNRYNLSPYPVFDRLKGRQSKIELDVQYTASPEWRTLYEAITTQAAIITFGNGTHTVALQFNGNNLIDDVSDDLQPGKIYNQKVMYENQWDTSASQDISFAFT